jgi:hypothetical protein
VLLQKGDTKVALYGIGSQRDDRLARALTDEKVTFLCPNEDAAQWFNILGALSSFYFVLIASSIASKSSRSIKNTFHWRPY